MPVGARCLWSFDPNSRVGVAWFTASVWRGVACRGRMTCRRQHSTTTVGWSANERMIGEAVHGPMMNDSWLLPSRGHPYAFVLFIPPPVFDWALVIFGRQPKHGRSRKGENTSFVRVIHPSRSWPTSEAPSHVARHREWTGPEVSMSSMGNTA